MKADHFCSGVPGLFWSLLERQKCSIPSERAVPEGFGFRETQSKTIKIHYSTDTIF